MREKRYTFSQVFDIYGVRVLVADTTTCYAALGVLHEPVQADPGQVQGLHRDPEGQRLPVAAHDAVRPVRHAARGADPHARHAPDRRGRRRRALAVQDRRRARPRARRSARRIAGCKACSRSSRESRDSKEFLENIKGDLFPDEIYVFTPKGKIMALPRGATAVDFAYARAHRRRPPLRRGADQLRAAAAAHRAQERRPRRDPDVAVRAAESVVAVVRRDRQGALADPPLPEGAAAEGIGGARRAAARAGARHAQGRARIDLMGSLGSAAEGIRRQEPARHPRRHRPRQAAVVRRRAGADARRRQGATEPRARGTRASPRR